MSRLFNSFAFIDFIMALNWKTPAIILIFSIIPKPIPDEIIETQNPEPKEIVLEPEILIENLEVPWAIAFLPSGEMLFTERKGKVSLFDGKTKKAIGTINVSQQSES